MAEKSKSAISNFELKVILAIVVIAWLYFYYEKNFKGSTMPRMKYKHTEEYDIDRRRQPSSYNRRSIETYAEQGRTDRSIVSGRSVEQNNHVNNTNLPPHQRNTTQPTTPPPAPPRNTSTPTQAPYNPPPAQRSYNRYNEYGIPTQWLDNCLAVDGFDMPVGWPDGKGYYIALGYGKDQHLGEDWNGVGGGNTDLNDAVSAVADGVIFSAKDEGGKWGNVIRIAHNIGTARNPRFIESYYAHLNEINVYEGDIVRRGQKIGKIGTGNGQYTAHLHFEMRQQINERIKRSGFGDSNTHISPTDFIQENRPQRR